jgi:hypothetical protein
METVHYGPRLNKSRLPNPLLSVRTKHEHSDAIGAGEEKEEKKKRKRRGRK